MKKLFKFDLFANKFVVADDEMSAIDTLKSMSFSEIFEDDCIEDLTSCRREIKSLDEVFEWQKNRIAFDQDDKEKDISVIEYFENHDKIEDQLRKENARLKKKCNRLIKKNAKK